jgi:hypothetical protein
MGGELRADWGAKLRLKALVLRCAVLLRDENV